MAATPFKLILTARPVKGGPPFGLRISASDVAGALVTFDDDGAGTGYTVPVNTGGLIVEDLVASAAGVDTVALQLRNGIADTTIIVRDSLLASTSVEAGTRLQALRGAVLQPGSRYGFRQLA